MPEKIGKKHLSGEDAKPPSHKHEIRNPNFETNPNASKASNYAGILNFGFEYSDLFRISCFGLAWISLRLGALAV
jgi:hypothetical protein